MPAEKQTVECESCGKAFKPTGIGIHRKWCLRRIRRAEEDIAYAEILRNGAWYTYILLLLICFGSNTMMRQLAQIRIAQAQQLVRAEQAQAFHRKVRHVFPYYSHHNHKLMVLIRSFRTLAFTRTTATDGYRRRSRTTWTWCVPSWNLNILVDARIFLPSFTLPRYWQYWWYPSRIPPTLSQTHWKIFILWVHPGPCAQAI